MANRLESFLDPVLSMTWGDLGAIRRAAKLDERMHVEVELGYPADDLVAEYRDALSEWLGERVELTIKFQPPNLRGIPGAKNIIAVASGKGGVGKSTVAVNLALALDRIGAKVGILDADIYGPSQGIMLGIPDGRRPEVKDEKFFLPVKAHGIEAMSMSMLVTEKTPMVWRGPMASGALQQLIGQTAWGDLDYLVVDMPPGTGDIQLTLSQAVPVGGAVIVTTPQEIALADAKKGIEMFRKVDIPILGIVENMSYFRCDECGKEHHLFGEGGGARVAAEYATVVLARLPLVQLIREHTDAGTPTVIADPTSEVAGLYRDCARATAAALLKTLGGMAAAPTISFEDN